MKLVLWLQKSLLLNLKKKMPAQNAGLIKSQEVIPKGPCEDVFGPNGEDASFHCIPQALILISTPAGSVSVFNASIVLPVGFKISIKR